MPEAGRGPRLTRRDRCLLAAGLAVFLAGLIAVLDAAPYSAVRVEGDRLILAGTIVSRTPRQVERALRQTPGIRMLEQTLVWGSVDSAALNRLGRSVRRAGLAPHLGAEAEVYSGGSVLFLAGRERTMEDGAIIGVHAWRDGHGIATDFPPGSPLHEPERSFVRDMLGADAFYWFYIAAAPPDGMHILTAEEIARFGLVTDAAASNAAATAGR